MLILLQDDSSQQVEAEPSTYTEYKITKSTDQIVVLPKDLIDKQSDSTDGVDSYWSFSYLLYIYDFL